MSNKQHPQRRNKAFKPETPPLKDWFEKDNSIFDGEQALPPEIVEQAKRLPPDLRAVLNLSVLIQRSSGSPWPTPDEIKAWEEHLPGRGAQIMDDIQKQLDHTRDIEKREMSLKEYQSKKTNQAVLWGQLIFATLGFSLIGLLVWAVIVAPTLAVIVGGVITTAFTVLGTSYAVNQVKKQKAKKKEPKK